MMEPSEHGMRAIEDIVAETFVKVHQDLETILSSTEIPSAVAASDEQLPALQLGHGRTYSESEEYINELNIPFRNLSEAIVDITNNRTVAEAAATEAAIESRGVQLVRKHTTNDSDREGQPGRTGSFLEPSASGPCTALDINTPSPHACPVVLSTLSYEELLDRAIAGMDPKLQQMSNNLLHRRNSKAAIDRQRSSNGRRSSGGGSTAARPKSCGRAPVAQERVEATYKQSWQPQSKFPASSANNKTAAGRPSDGDGSRSLRIFKQGSGAAMQLLGELQDKPTSSAAAWQKGSQRSNSAPREIASVERHVQRMIRSPGRRGSSDGPSAGVALEQQAKSSPSQTLSYIERLYAVGKEKQLKRVHQPHQRCVSPESMRLSEQDWNRVTARLYNDARQKEERMRVRREHAAEEVVTAAGGPSVSDRLHSMDAQQARCNAKRSGGGVPSADFYRRQEAAWKRREERIEAGKRRPSIGEEDERECTFKPEISATSKQLCSNRSVDELFKWEDHRRIHVWQLYEDKAEHEVDPDRYTWAPKIDERSRRLALQRYAASPDDRRPWTKSPRHTSAPPRQASPPRKPSPPPRSIYSASFSMSHGIKPEPDYSYASPEQLRHSIAGPLMHSGSPASAGGSYVQIRQAPSSEPAAATTSKAMFGQSVGSAAKQLTYAEGNARQNNFTVWEREQHRLQNEALPSGVVLGIPVYGAPAAVASAALPEDAASIQTQQLQTSPAAKGLVPVAPGDGVAFISLAAIRTRANQAAAETVAAAAGAILSEVDLESGIPAAAGAESRQSANRVRTSRDDSAANTPLKQQYSASAASKAAAAARAFRDDSAGGMHVPSRKISTGGSYFSPVVSAQKALPQSRLKHQDVGIGTGLQPSLSDGTQAALELSHLGFQDASHHNLAAAAAMAARQQVPAYYVGVDYSANLSDGYSARYAYSQAAAATAAGKGGYSAEFIATAYTAGALTDYRVEAGKKAGNVEWQQQLAAGGVKQHYSTAQLLNAKQRGSSAGLMPLSAEPSHDSGYAVMEAPAAAVAAGEFLANARATRGDVVCCINQEPSAQLVAEQTVVEPGQLHELLAEKAEGMLDQTQSVPYELNMSPRSRLYLSSSAEGKPAHQLLALISKAGATHGSRTKLNEGNDSVLSPAAGSPHLPDSNASNSAITSHNLLAATNLHREQLPTICGTSKLSSTSSATPAAPASPAKIQQANLTLQLADTQGAEAVAAVEQVGKAEAAAATDDSARTVPVKPPVEVPAAEGEAAGAAEVFALLFDPTMTPTDKARRMQEIFKKTISKHTIPLNALEQTIAAMMPAAGAAETVPAAAPAASSIDADDAASVCAPTAASQQAAPPETAVTLSIPAAALPKSPVAAPAAVKPFQSESIQDLLAQMNEFEATAASPTAVGPCSGSPSCPCSSPSCWISGSAIMAPSSKAEAAASSNSSCGAPQIPARRSYAAAVMPRTQSGSGSDIGASCSSPSRATCRITQGANVSQVVEQNGVQQSGSGSAD